MNNKFRLQSIIESLLFVSGREVSLKRLQEISGATEQEIMLALNDLDNQYLQDESRGLRLLAHEGSVELVTAGKNAVYAQELSRSEQKEALSEASLETLAILVYSGPLSKPAIDQLRGINSSLILRNLLVRGYVEIARRKDTGEEVYRVTDEFLRQMGKERVDEFPEYDQLHAELHPEIAA